jgi:hypothetical protein
VQGRAQVGYPHLTGEGTRAGSERYAQRDSVTSFSSLFIFIKQLLLVPFDMYRRDFKFGRIFVEFFVFEVDSPLCSPPGGLTFPCVFTTGESRPGLFTNEEPRLPGVFITGDSLYDFLKHVRTFTVIIIHKID